MINFLKSFKISQSIGYPVKEIVEQIKSDPKKFKVEVGGGSNPSMSVTHTSSPKYSFFLFPTSAPILAFLFRSPMWYNSDDIQWMNNKEKSYVYQELLNFKPESEEDIRSRWAEAFGVVRGE